MKEEIKIGDSVMLINNGGHAAKIGARAWVYKIDANYIYVVWKRFWPFDSWNLSRNQRNGGYSREDFIKI